MLLAFEDRRFYSHIGVDPYALTRAGVEFVRYGRIISGARP
jgi:penicillin-binding protein 1C